MAIYDEDPKVVAYILKQQTLDMMARIDPIEITGNDWDKSPTRSPNVTALLKQQDQLFNGVKNDILLSENLSEQQKVYDFYVKLVAESVSIGNFQTAKYIGMGVFHSSVDRLTYLEEGCKYVPEQAVIKKMFGDLSKSKTLDTLNMVMKGVGDSNVEQTFPLIKPFDKVMYDLGMMKSKMEDPPKPLTKLQNDLQQAQNELQNLEQLKVNISNPNFAGNKIQVQEQIAMLEQNGEVEVRKKNIEHLMAQVSLFSGETLQQMIGSLRPEQQMVPLKNEPPIELKQNILNWIDKEKILKSDESRDDFSLRSLAILPPSPPVQKDKKGRPIVNNTKIEPFADQKAINKNIEERFVANMTSSLIELKEKDEEKAKTLTGVASVLLSSGIPIDIKSSTYESDKKEAAKLCKTLLSDRKTTVTGILEEVRVQLKENENNPAKQKDILNRSEFLLEELVKMDVTDNFQKTSGIADLIENVNFDSKSDNDVMGNPKESMVKDKLSEIQKLITADDYKTLASEVKSAIKPKLEPVDAPVVQSTRTFDQVLANIDSKKPDKKAFKGDVEAMAHDLMVLSAKTYGQVKMDEFFKEGWDKEGKEKNAPNLIELQNVVNSVNNNLVAPSITEAKNTKTGENRAIFWANVLQKLIDNHDYSTAAALHTQLQALPSSVHENKEFKKLLNESAKFFAKNNLNLRAAMRDDEKYIPPVTTVYQTEIVMHNQSEDVDNTNNIRDVEKLLLIGNSINSSTSQTSYANSLQSEKVTFNLEGTLKKLSEEQENKKINEKDQENIILPVVEKGAKAAIHTKDNNGTTLNDISWHLNNFGNKEFTLEFIEKTSKIGGGDDERTITESVNGINSKLLTIIQNKLNESPKDTPEYTNNQQYAVGIINSLESRAKANKTPFNEDTKKLIKKLEADYNLKKVKPLTPTEPPKIPVVKEEEKIPEIKPVVEKNNTTEVKGEELKGEEVKKKEKTHKRKKTRTKDKNQSVKKDQEELIPMMMNEGERDKSDDKNRVDIDGKPIQHENPLNLNEGKEKVDSKVRLESESESEEKFLGVEGNDLKVTNNIAVSSVKPSETIVVNGSFEHESSEEQKEEILQKVSVESTSEIGDIHIVEKKSPTIKNDDQKLGDTSPDRENSIKIEPQENKSPKINSFLNHQSPKRPEDDNKIHVIKSDANLNDKSKPEVSSDKNNNQSTPVDKISHLNSILTTPQASPNTPSSGATHALEKPVRPAMFFSRQNQTKEQNKEYHQYRQEVKAQQGLSKPKEPLVKQQVQQEVQQEVKQDVKQESSVEAGSVKNKVQSYEQAIAKAMEKGFVPHRTNSTTNDSDSNANQKKNTGINKRT